MTARLVPQSTDVVVLCGGRGTRLGALTAETPKPLLPVGERPFLWYVLRRLRQEGFGRVILAAHYLAERFDWFLSAHRDVASGVTLLVEPEPLGTGGAMRNAADHGHSPTLVVVNGDSWVSQSLADVLAFHQEVESALTLVGVRSLKVEGGAYNKGVLSIGSKDELMGFSTPAFVSGGWVNGGMYIVDREMVRSWPQGCYALEEDITSLLSGRRGLVFRSEGRLLDIGTPACYQQAIREFADLGGFSPPSAFVEVSDGV